MGGSIAISSFYLALMGLIFVPMTFRVARYRIRHRISLGDNGDQALIRLIRAHGNFVETVPIALILLLAVEINGAPEYLLHGLGLVLLVARLSHYFNITGVLRSAVFRVGGMAATFTVYLVSAVWLLIAAVKTWS